MELQGTVDEIYYEEDDVVVLKAPAPSQTLQDTQLEPAVSPDSEAEAFIFEHHVNFKRIREQDRKISNEVKPRLKGGESGRVAEKIILRQLRQVDENFVSVAPVDGDLFELLGSMQGPPTTPFEGGTFFISLSIPKTYPLSPPICHFLTPVLHPNVDINGRITASFLRQDNPLAQPDSWCPVWNISTTLVGICSLLDDPNWLEPSFIEVADRYGKDAVGYEIEVRRFTEIYARRNAPPVEPFAEAFEELFTTAGRERRYDVQGRDNGEESYLSEAGVQVDSIAARDPGMLYYAVVHVVAFMVFSVPSIYFILRCIRI